MWIIKCSLINSYFSYSRPVQLSSRLSIVTIFQRAAGSVVSVTLEVRKKDFLCSQTITPTCRSIWVGFKFRRTRHLEGVLIQHTHLGTEVSVCSRFCL